MVKTMDQIREDHDKRHRLNAEIAQRLLGLTVEWDEMRVRLNGPDSDEMVLRFPVEIWSDGLHTMITDYAGNIGEAWEVVEAMKDKGWDIAITSYSGPLPPWECVFERNHPHDIEMADGDDLAAAICRAALRALDWEEVHGPAKSSTT